METNPFHDLYLSETISEDSLVELFSPIIVEHSLAMFESGHVVVRGLQGTGKTMLLNLLRPASRLAYHRADIPYPVPEKLASFIGAGINLRKCGALEFAQHIELETNGRGNQELELLFGDFFNCWVVSDLISSIKQFIDAGNDVLLKNIGVRPNLEGLDDFARILSLDECWFGALDGVETLEALSGQLAKRINQYRKFLNLNGDLPPEIRTTKTVIGDPILKAVDALKAARVIKEATKIFVRIDQYEQLTTLNMVGTKFGANCQELIHKAMASRDGRVSYKVGTRTHGWPARPNIYKTNDVLERKRDYDVIDMDEIFRRRENASTWIFPEFARDIFARRLRESEYSRDESGPTSVGKVLGLSLKPSERAKQYVSTVDGRKQLVEKSIKALPEIISKEWRSYIAELGREDILAAWLACAWVRQKSIARRGVTPLGDPPSANALPWSGKPYWYKERVQHGLMQLASANRQALKWSGEDDLLSLSGGQILVFLFLLQHVWDAWLRDRRGSKEHKFKFPVKHDVQSQGVWEASNEWRRKQIEGANALVRKTFVDALGAHIYIGMINDKFMSYPGANGFSVANSELAQNKEVFQFLCEADGFGDLYFGDHTSKRKGERRSKYYLAPILSPYYRIPSVHTKEPEYVKIEQVASWMTQKINRPDASKDAEQGDFWSEGVS